MRKFINTFPQSLLLPNFLTPSIYYAYIPDIHRIVILPQMLQTATTPSAMSCHPPLLTAQSFFLSVGIYTATAVLLYCIYSLLVLRAKRRDPKNSYAWIFGKLVMDMKAVINFEESNQGIYDDPGTPVGYNARQHILFWLRHIDKVHGPNAIEPLGDLIHVQPVIADLTPGVEIEEGAKITVIGSSGTRLGNVGV
jgi:hypothetical protein